MYKIVNEKGEQVFQDLYTKEGAEKIWDMYNGIAEDENGNEIRIYIEEE